MVNLIIRSSGYQGFDTKAISSRGKLPSNGDDGGLGDEKGELALERQPPLVEGLALAMCDFGISDSFRHWLSYSPKMYKNVLVLVLVLVLLVLLLLLLLLLIYS